MTTILAVRHAQASFGAANYDQLSPLGEKQAGLLGQWFKDIGIVPDAVVTGGLTRHRQTAEIALSAMPCQAEIVELDQFREFDSRDVMECHAPDFRTRHFERVKAGEITTHKDYHEVFVQSVTRWVSGRHDPEYKQSWPVFQSRVREGLAEMVEAHSGAETVLLVTSGGPLTVLFQVMTGMSNTAVFDMGYSLLNCGLSRMQTEGDKLRLRSFNAVPHLERMRDKDLITYI
jgi:broad specificity phosphatase PhoE